MADRPTPREVVRDEVEDKPELLVDMRGGTLVTRKQSNCRTNRIRRTYDTKTTTVTLSDAGTAFQVLGVVGGIAGAVGLLVRAAGDGESNAATATAAIGGSLGLGALVQSFMTGVSDQQVPVGTLTEFGNTWKTCTEPVPQSVSVQVRYADGRQAVASDTASRGELDVANMSVPADEMLLDKPWLRVDVEHTLLARSTSYIVKYENSQVIQASRKLRESRCTAEYQAIERLVLVGKWQTALKNLDESQRRCSDPQFTQTVSALKVGAHASGCTSNNTEQCEKACAMRHPASCAKKRELDEAKRAALVELYRIGSPGMMEIDGQTIPMARLATMLPDDLVGKRAVVYGYVGSFQYQGLQQVGYLDQLREDRDFRFDFSLAPQQAAFGEQLDVVIQGKLLSSFSVIAQAGNDLIMRKLGGENVSPNDMPDTTKLHEEHKASVKEYMASTYQTLADSKGYVKKVRVEGKFDQFRNNRKLFFHASTVTALPRQHVLEFSVWVDRSARRVREMLTLLGGAPSAEQRKESRGQLARLWQSMQPSEALKELQERPGDEQAEGKAHLEMVLNELRAEVQAILSSRGE